MSCIECVALNIRHVFTTVADGCCKDGYEVPVQWPFMVAFCLCSFSQWELQDPKMEVLYHIRSYFGGICPYISLIEALYLVVELKIIISRFCPIHFTVTFAGT